MFAPDHRKRRTPLNRERIIRFLLTGRWCLLASVALLAAPRSSLAQTTPPAAPDYSVNTKSLPNFISPYRTRRVPTADLSNSKTLSEMIRDGKIELSLSQLAAAVVENNLNVALARYDIFFAQADLLRTKGGQAARGVSESGASIPDPLFAAAIGAGLGNAAALGGGIGGVGSISGSTKSLSFEPRGAYDPSFLFNFSWDRTASPLNTIVVAGSPVVTTNTAFYQFGWQQAFTTGTSLSVAMANQRQNSTQQSLIYNPDVVSRMTVALVQELTNGFSRQVNRRFMIVARNNRALVQGWFLQQVDTILAQAEDSYWDLVAAQEQVKATQEALNAAQQLYEVNKKEAEVGTLAPLDVVSAQSQMAANQRDLIIAQTNLQQQELTLKTLLSKRVTADLADAQIMATDPLPDAQDADIPPLDDAQATATRNRPELPQAQETVENDRVGAQVTRNFLKPSFNAFGFFATAGLSGNQLIASSSGGAAMLMRAGLGAELTQLVRFKYPEYAAGFSLTIPLRNRSALADNIRAQMQEQQAEASLRKTANQIGVEVRSAIVSLTQAKSQVAATSEAVNYSRQNLDAEQKKRAAGLSTPYNVTLAQRDFLNAELAEVQARTSYAKAKVEMDRSMGVLLEKSRIKVEDAIRGQVSQTAGTP